MSSSACPVAQHTSWHALHPVRRAWFPCAAGLRETARTEPEVSASVTNGIATGPTARGHGATHQAPEVIIVTRYCSEFSGTLRHPHAGGRRGGAHGAARNTAATRHPRTAPLAPAGPPTQLQPLLGPAGSAPPGLPLLITHVSFDACIEAGTRNTESRVRDWGAWVSRAQRRAVDAQAGGQRRVEYAERTHVGMRVKRVQKGSAWVCLCPIHIRLNPGATRTR
jgi:hypothetical protein